MAKALDCVVGCVAFGKCAAWVGLTVGLDRPKSAQIRGFGVRIEVAGARTLNSEARILPADAPFLRAVARILRTDASFEVAEARILLAGAKIVLAEAPILKAGQEISKSSYLLYEYGCLLFTQRSILQISDRLLVLGLGCAKGISHTVLRLALRPEFQRRSYT